MAATDTSDAISGRTGTRTGQVFLRKRCVVKDKRLLSEQCTIV
jgi:hypothetical protein